MSAIDPGNVFVVLLTGCSTFFAIFSKSYILIFVLLRVRWTRDRFLSTFNTFFNYSAILQSVTHNGYFFHVCTEPRKYFLSSYNWFFDLFYDTTQNLYMKIRFPMSAIIPKTGFLSTYNRFLDFFGIPRKVTHKYSSFYVYDRPQKLFLSTFNKFFELFAISKVLKLENSFFLREKWTPKTLLKYFRQVFRIFRDASKNYA